MGKSTLNKIGSGGSISQMPRMTGKLEKSETTPYEQVAGDYGMQGLAQLAPLRNDIIQQAIGIQKGTLDPRSTNLFASGARAIGDAFGNARDEILENTPSGAAGLRQRQLSDAALQTAEAKGNLANQIANALITQAMGTGADSTAALASMMTPYASRYNTNIQTLQDFNKGTADFFAQMFGRNTSGIGDRRADSAGFNAGKNSGGGSGNTTPQGGK